MQQVSVFAENQRGMMEKITGVLRSEDINILGSVTNDSAEYGIVRMVVSNPSAAVDALTKAGLLCHLTEVVGVELMDEVGNLNQLLQALSESNINVNYLYLSFNRETGMPIMVYSIINVQMNNSQEGTFTCPSGNSFICTFKNSP